MTRAQPWTGSAGRRPEEAERYLLSLELFGMRFGLDRMRRLMTALGHPERAFQSIHVVGTNGKSSTTRMIAAILARHGLRTGAYLSPHLVSFGERIRIDDRDLNAEPTSAPPSPAPRAPPSSSTAPLDADDRVTQFEALTAAAYSELARQGVEVAVIEAGLGGRYDATNVIPSTVQVLTSVGLEHTRWLGPTLDRHRRREARRGAAGGDARARRRAGARGGGGRRARVRRARAPGSSTPAPIRACRGRRAGRLPAAQLRAGAGRRRGLPGRARRWIAVAWPRPRRRCGSPAACSRSAPIR